MDAYEEAYARHERRSRILEDYSATGLSLEQVRSTYNSPKAASRGRASIDSWKYWLNQERIYKTLNHDEKVYLKHKIDSVTKPSDPTMSGTVPYLVIAGNELLLSNEAIERAYSRIENPTTDKNPTCRALDIILLPSRLYDPRDTDMFRTFQKIFLNTRVYFESSFDAKIWAPDSNGLHARSRGLPSQLEILSDFHNQMVEALRQFAWGNTSKAWTMLRTTFDMIDRLVGIQHHRLFSDLLGVLLLTQQQRHPDAPALDAALREWLLQAARRSLPLNDPRRQFFEYLACVPLETVSHLYRAFDQQGRALWHARMKDNEIEAYYSYNQASFPRADRGRFYSLFEEKGIGKIRDILRYVDTHFGMDNTETFCLWHTALQYLFITSQYREMAIIADELCVRLIPFKNGWDHSRPKQLNHDAAMSFYL